MKFQSKAMKLRAKSCSLKFKAFILVVLSSAISIIYFGYIFKYFSHILETRVPIASHECEVSSEQKQQLFDLLKMVKEVLEKLNITYFLCYQSLWGAIRESGPLPWSTTAELCVLGSNIVNIDETAIFREFKNRNLDLNYNSAEGEYKVRDISKPENCFVKLISFESDIKVGSMYKRVGWKRRLLPPDCDAQPSLQCFPSHLINPPLPLKSFGPLDFPGPKEDIDLLKFHYPDTWWKPLKPVCK